MFWQVVQAQIDLKNATITIKGAGTGDEITVKVGEGNCTWSEKKNIQYTLNGGVLDEVREGDEVPVDVKLDCTWEYIASQSGSPVPPDDAIRGINTASSWTSSDADTCRPFAVDLEIEIQPVCSGTDSGDSDIYTLADFRCEDVAYDLRAGTLSFSGKCNVTRANRTVGTA